MSALNAAPLNRMADRERLFVKLRFGALLILLAILYLDPQQSGSLRITLYVVAAGILFNFLAWLLLRFRRLVRGISLISSFGEGLTLLYFMFASGGSQSPLWQLVFVFIASTALRHGTGGGFVTAVVFSAITIIYALLEPSGVSIGIYQSFVRSIAYLVMGLVVGWVINYEQRQSVKESQQAEQALQHTQFDVDVFKQLTGTISSNTNYQITLQEMLELSMRGLRSRGRLEETMSAMILLFDNTKEESLFVAAQRNLSPSDEARHLKPISGAIKTVLNSVDPLFVKDAKRDPLLAQFETIAKLPSICILPLRAALTLYGVVVYAGTDKLVDVFQHRLDLMEAYAAQAAIAVQNAQLYSQLREEHDRIVDGEEKARHELARDLHDGPINAVASLTMGIDFARRLLDEDPVKAREELSTLHRQAAKTARDMRMTMYRLRPLALETAGLSAALEQYVTRMQTERKEPRLHFSGPNPNTFEPRLSQNAATMVFDIMKEAVGNALKHAEAKNIWINLNVKGDWLIASTSDDGKGFDVQAIMSGYTTRGSMGMINIQERAELAQGDSRIESSPGRGTTITVQVPLGR
jgi:signal transduction histidine kinase